MSNRDYYPEKKASVFMRLFWKAAGADRYILERSTYGDQIKYLCLGGIILATGLMAGLAGGYAFYTIFLNPGATRSIPFKLRRIFKVYTMPYTLQLW